MIYRRVVVTGIGAITPVGLTAQETWQAILQGKSGVGPIQGFDAQNLPVRIAAEVKATPLMPLVAAALAEARSRDFDARELRRFSRFMLFALKAAAEAICDAGLNNPPPDSERFSVSVGVGMGGLGELEEVHLSILKHGFKGVSPMSIPRIVPNMAAGVVASAFSARGAVSSPAAACASGSQSIGHAFDWIRRGQTDVALAGGAEAVISLLGIGGFAAMRALSTRNESSETASRPFDRDRDGFVMGEGAAMLVLEDFERARARGAKIYAEIAGYAETCDGASLIRPTQNGDGAYRTMKLAMEDGKIPLDCLDYINAHGTSTQTGDIEEARAIARLLGPLCPQVHVASTKSMTGHLIGAAGALEAMLTVLSIRDRVIPPTMNIQHLDPACQELGIQFGHAQTTEKEVRVALSNSFGFGGINACLALRRHEAKPPTR